MIEWNDGRMGSECVVYWWTVEVVHCSFSRALDSMIMNKWALSCVSALGDHISDFHIEDDDVYRRLRLNGAKRLEMKNSKVDILSYAGKQTVQSWPIFSFIWREYHQSSSVEFFSNSSLICFTLSSWYLVADVPMISGCECICLPAFEVDMDMGMGRSIMYGVWQCIRPIRKRFMYLCTESTVELS